MDNHRYARKVLLGVILLLFIIWVGIKVNQQSDDQRFLMAGTQVIISTPATVGRLWEAQDQDNQTILPLGRIQLSGSELMVGDALLPRFSSTFRKEDLPMGTFPFRLHLAWKDGDYSIEGASLMFLEEKTITEWKVAYNSDGGTGFFVDTGLACMAGPVVFKKWQYFQDSLKTAQKSSGWYGSQLQDQLKGNPERGVSSDWVSYPIPNNLPELARQYSNLWY